MVRPSDVESISISRATGRLSNDSTPEALRMNTLTYNTNIPADGDYTPIDIDTSCLGLAAPLTPTNQKVTAYVFQPISITTFDMNDIVERYSEQNKILTE